MGVDQVDDKSTPTPYDQFRDPPASTGGSYDIVLQPKTRPTSQEELEDEVKGIYAGLIMAEEKWRELLFKYTREQLPYRANVEFIRFYKLVPETETEITIVTWYSQNDAQPPDNEPPTVAAKSRSSTKKPDPPKMEKVYVEDRVLGKVMFVDPLTIEHHQSLRAFLRTLIHEYHDFFLASQHPNATTALNRLAMKYDMPSKLWRYGMQEFLEFNRHRLETEGGIREHMMATFLMDYNMLASLWETAVVIQEPSPVVKSKTLMPHERRQRKHETYKRKDTNQLRHTFAEYLGDLSRFGSVTDDKYTRTTWVETAIRWYMEAYEAVPGTGRLLNRLAILSPHNILLQMALFSSAIAAPRPFDDGRASMIEPLVRIMQQQSSKITDVEQAFVVTFGYIYSLAQNAESRSKLKFSVPSYEPKRTQDELDASIMHLADIMKRKNWLVGHNIMSEGAKHLADAQKKPASTSMNAEQKLWKERRSEVPKMVKVPSKWLNIAVLLCNMFLMMAPMGMTDPMQDALAPKPPKPEARSTAELLGNGGESAEKQDANASPSDDKPATTETAVSIDQALKSESPESQEVLATSKQDRPKKNSSKTPEQDDKSKEDSSEQGGTASPEPRKKKITVAEVNVDHIKYANGKGWEEFADFCIIEVDNYDVQPEPEKAPKRKEFYEQENISETAVEIESPTLTETDLQALHQAESAQCKYVFSQKLKLLRLVCTARFDHLLKETREEAWDKGTLQYLHVILTFMRYVAAKRPVGDAFRNAFRADQIAELVTRILRLYRESKGDYWQKIHSDSFPRFEVRLEFPRAGDGLMNTPLPEDFFQRGLRWAQEADASGDEVFFGEDLPNKEESPDDDQEEPLLEKGEENGQEDENRAEGALLITNIEKVKTPDDKAKEVEPPAPKNPDPQKEEWEPPNGGVRDGTLYPQGFFATHDLDLEQTDWEHQGVNHQRMVRIAWLVVWMAKHDMWFNFDAKTCTITAKYLDEEEFAWEPQEFRMPAAEQAEDAENTKENQEASETEATAPKRTKETNFDVVSSYTESFEKLVAVGIDKFSEAGVDEALEVRAGGNGPLSVDHFLANEVKYDPVSEWVGNEIARDGGKDETMIGGKAQGGEANKSDSGSGSFQVPSV